ncbi:AraC protein arabinose-binding/dimerization [[Clostridium] cellulosi]|uniref:AraC protein arabinose-binding/dimerization n=1 Tax=[Clostridium] cellulosi TaxID=29343 RepID=A0A078KRC6_9FIRM|nr:MAG: AraC family transcriptional regulator [[Clostridium] cellulosi]CDZ24948.1 AraC protein arabinose-binding/dimerization [[Clostridium] cellulosi]
MKIEGLHEKEIFEEKFPFRLLNQDIDFNYPAHWHTAIEIIYVLKHSFTVLADSAAYFLRERDILFLPGGCIHEFKNEIGQGRGVFINFELSSLSPFDTIDCVRSKLCDVKLITSENNPLHSKIEKEILNMVKESQNHTFMSPLYYAARSIDILLSFCKDFDSKTKVREKDENIVSGLEKINKSFEYIEKNYCHDIHLKDIAKAVGFSEYYFSRLFKTITKKRFHQYLNEFRIKKAEQLLSQNYSISEVANKTGFSSTETFKRTFKKIKGYSPKVSARNVWCPK